MARVTYFAVEEDVICLRVESISRRVYHRNVSHQYVSQDAVFDDGEPERTVLKILHGMTKKQNTPYSQFNENK